jgi:hypothetical protein
MPTLYDSACDELARHFLDDDETNTPRTKGIHESRVASLAVAIQEAVEAWIDDEPTLVTVE